MGVVPPLYGKNLLAKQENKTKAGVPAATNRILHRRRSANTAEDGRAEGGSAEKQRDGQERAVGGRREQSHGSRAQTWRGHSAVSPGASRRGGVQVCGCGCAHSEPLPRRPRSPGVGGTLSPPQVPERLSPERGSKVTTNTATTWSSSTSPSPRRPGCSGTSEGPSSSRSRRLGGSAAGRPPPPLPQPRPPACSSGACGGETAGPSAQRSSGAASPRSTMAKRGGAAGGEGRAQGRAAGTPLAGRPPGSALAPRLRAPRPAPAPGRPAPGADFPLAPGRRPPSRFRGTACLIWDSGMRVCSRV